MANTVRERVSSRIDSAKVREHYLALLACIALIVAGGVALIVRQRGFAMTHQETILDCHYEGVAAHTHTSDCYDKSGTLICPLPERALHVHDDSCYTEEQVLVCGLEEGEDHTHTDECYETQRTLTCGQEEVTEEHVHGPGCFKTVTVRDSDGAIISEEEAAALEAAPAPLVMSEEPQVFEEVIKDANDQPLIKVHVEAPAGAFPVGTTMKVKMVDSSEVEQAVTDAVAKTNNGSVTQIQSVDITFYDPYDAEIEPAKEISVTLASALIAENESPMIVHIDNEGKADVVNTLTEEQLRERNESAAADELKFDADNFSIYSIASTSGAKRVISGLKASFPALVSTLANAPRDALSFKSNKFSTYSIVVTTLHKVLKASDGNTYNVIVECPDEARIPDGAELEVTELVQASEYDPYLNKVGEELAANETIEYVRFFDISIVSNGEKVQPQAPVSVRIELAENVASEADTQLRVTHFSDDASDVQDVDAEVHAGYTQSVVSFEAESFSVYAIVATVIEKEVTLASDGRTYRISAYFPAEAKIPGNAELDVFELMPGTAEYDAYLAEAAQTLGYQPELVPYAKLLDISVMVDGTKIQPAEGANVSISIDLLDKTENGPETQVVHFGDQVEVLESNAEGQVVSFETTGFSVYAIVDAPKPAVISVTTPDELKYYLDETFYLSIKRDGSADYFTSALNSNSAFVTDRNIEDASEWSFVAVEGKENTYLIGTMVNGVQKYAKNTSGNLMGLTENVSEATEFVVSQYGNGTFTFKVNGQNKWLQWSGSGNGIRLYTDNKNQGNSQITLTCVSSVDVGDDPYELNGKKYGIAYNDGNLTSAALTAEAKTVSNQQRLAGQDMLMKPDVLDNKGIMLVAHDSDIQEFTFVSQGEDYYYLTTQVDGQTKYLTVDGANVTLADEPDADKSLVRAVPGVGSYAGKWHFTVGNRSLNLPGNASQGFNAITTNNATTWMNLVEKAPIEESDFKTYTAKKVSVSDTLQVYDGAQVIIYTRVWNDTKKRYEFFAVDHDGSLIPCNDNGDSIEWIGTGVNTALWSFTEYFDENGNPTNFYDIQNVQYHNWIAPQVSSGQILSNDVLGLNLNGRRFGQDYTTIIAWDDDNYSYSGLKTKDGQVVASSLSEAEDFYFAIVNPIDPDDRLSTVATIDNGEYGITMKMVDFNNPLVNNRDSVQNPFFGSRDTDLKKPDMGLLTTDLTDGYPVTTDLTRNGGHSLGELFSGMTDVNHLFIESIHNESGYFEYNSTSNFAHLNDDGNFTVYDQLGAIGNQTGPTRTHGQFMPYNDLVPGLYARDAAGNLITNKTNVLAEELPDTDPRKGEKLYLIPQNEADYFFGMEMEANFTQTADGKDDWGHDIIFEFSGDDDFWFYVDGELVLDLGGVHSALPGSINFRTGDVINAGTQTTLYDIFRSNYEARGLSQDEINQKLEDKFELKNGNYVFKDYSNHTMKMFYMERGAGASNLHMRFNLASVKPGTFLLSKKLSGTDSESNDLIEFPYQIWYRSTKDAGLHLLEEKTDDEYNVTYKGTIAGVPYKDEFTPAGGAKKYKNVFFLKPGQTAQVALPDDAYGYYVVECGVNPAVYDEVKANGAVLAGEETGDMVGTISRRDYSISEDTLEERPKVDYVNHVADGAVRTLNITKRLYDSDGVTRLEYPADTTPFRFRLYLGNESADPANLPLANLYNYYVKDPAGNYCRWDSGEKKFVSLNITDYATLKAYLDTLTSDQQESIVFKTSQSGTISKIPADHTVEVRDLIVTTQYKLEERTDEIPKGYTLRLSDGYSRVDAGHEDAKADPIYDTIKSNEEPKLEVRNQKGWGLTVNKVWTDKDFMEEHDPIFFAVYVKNTDPTTGEPTGGETLLDGSVRKLPTTKTSLYYFFGNLQNVKFENYTVREVTLEGDYTVDSDGVVSGYTKVNPIKEGGELSIDGKPINGTYSTGKHYSYKVNYEPGEQTTQNENVRTDTVTNSRPGIKIYKTAWDYATPLAGAVFTLVDSSGHDVAGATYTSADNGLVTIAYLSHDTYTLTETVAPKGYVVLDSPATIVVNDNGTISVEGINEKFYTLTQATDTEMATITLRDRTTALVVKKVDALTDQPIEGVHFALYNQVTESGPDGQEIKRKDYQPIPDYSDLVTNADGVLEAVTMENLDFGTYYLTETRAVGDYDKLSEDICFTISKDGTVSIESGGDASWISPTHDEQGNATYTLAIPNGKMKKVSFKKVDISSWQTSALAGAKFDLYKVVDGKREDTPYLGGLVSGTDGLLARNGQKVFSLPIGEYQLIETEAPAGYYLKADPVDITITASDGQGAVSYNEGTNLSSSQSGQGLSYDNETGVFTLLISNSTGYELPKTGGNGTMATTMVGVVALMLAGLIFARRAKERFV